MSGQEYNYTVWEDEGVILNEQLYNRREMMIDTDEFMFQQNVYNRRIIEQQSYSPRMAFFYEQSSNVQGLNYCSELQSNYGRRYDYNEPPLLEELEIYPDQILQKIKAVLNPFNNNIPNDCDVGGPLLFYIALAFTMCFTGGKSNFGHIYIISVLGCIFMYILLKLMVTSDNVSFIGVISALGYSILPLLIFCAFGIVFHLVSFSGFVLAIAAVGWTSFAASKLMCTLIGDFSQQLVIMYPCALLYSLFILFIIF